MLNLRMSYIGLGVLICTIAGCGKPQQVEVKEVSVSNSASQPEVAAPAVKASDWAGWRGPHGDGTAPDQSIPLAWDDPKNIVWKVAVPGRGHADPTVVENMVVLATADEQAQVQSVVALNRQDGSQLWKVDLHQGNLEAQVHNKNTQATSTIAYDGERLFATFLNDKKIWITALNLKGEKLWSTNVGGFTSKFGYSASPTIYKSLVIIAADNHGGGYLAALNRETGDVVWLKERPAKATYASPIVFQIGGKDQLVIAGCDQIVSFDPNTGEQFWAVDGTTEACVGTVVRHGELVYASGGYPGSETVCIDASGKVVWRNTEKSYVPSLLQYNGYLYVVEDGGVATCLDAKTGDKKWQQRIGGNFSASPILVGSNLIAIDEAGKATVFEANPEKFVRVAEHQMGDEAFATPVACGNRLYLRVAQQVEGVRQEYLYCIGAPEVAANESTAETTAK
ncbi:MAG: PQQ-binding-like beta-propeller repeat protein [Planctomycetaceae bacterium]